MADFFEHDGEDSCTIKTGNFFTSETTAGCTKMSCIKGSLVRFKYSNYQGIFETSCYYLSSRLATELTL
jgi:hypothetical protein